MRFGKVKRVGGPGWCVVLPGIESATVVELRTQTIDVPKQEVITKDNIELHIDAVIYLKVGKDKQHVINSVVEVEDYKEATKLYVISLIRDVMGGMTLGGVISNIKDLNRKLKAELEKISREWGIEIDAVEIKDVDVPKTVIDAMHLQKAAVQEKLARVERAEAHMAEIDAVKKAAEQLGDRALAYYYVRALEKIGEGRSTKFIFPMELSRLADAVGGRIGGGTGPDIEELFKRYAPAITNVLSNSEKAKIRSEIRRKKKK